MDTILNITAGEFLYSMEMQVSTSDGESCIFHLPNGSYIEELLLKKALACTTPPSRIAKTSSDEILTYYYTDLSYDNFKKIAEAQRLP